MFDSMGVGGYSLKVDGELFGTLNFTVRDCTDSGYLEFENGSAVMSLGHPQNIATMQLTAAGSWHDRVACSVTAGPLALDELDEVVREVIARRHEHTEELERMVTVDFLVSQLRETVLARERQERDTCIVEIPRADLDWSSG